MAGRMSLFGSRRPRVAPEEEKEENQESHSGPPKAVPGALAKLVPTEASLARAASAAARRATLAFKTGPGKIQLHKEAVRCGCTLAKKTVPYTPS